MGSRRRSLPSAALLGVVGLIAAGCSLGNDTDGQNDNTGSTTSASTTTTTEVEARLFYTVRRGDTLVRIATRFDIDLNALVRENGIADPTRIYVGQQLLIPPPPGEEEGPQLTIAPPTNPNLPPIEPTFTLPTSTSSPQIQTPRRQ